MKLEYTHLGTIVLVKTRRKYNTFYLSFILYYGESLEEMKKRIFAVNKEYKYIKIYTRRKADNAQILKILDDEGWKTHCREFDEVEEIKIKLTPSNLEQFLDLIKILSKSYRWKTYWNDPNNRDLSVLK